jgi:hypothetical protein
MRSFLSSLTALLLCSACTSPQRRIDADPMRFQQYPPDVQAAIREGNIELGFAPDMVEMSLGRPRRIYSRTGTGDTTEIWEYAWIRSETTPTSAIVSDGRFSGSVWVDVRNTYEVPWQRVEFTDGVVTGIETLQE